MNTAGHHRLAKRGFTLVEMLVVIAVIGILAALLLPALSAAHRKANERTCLNNIRQLTLIACIYASENGSPILYNNPRYPDGCWMGSSADFIKDKKIFVCPSAPLHNPAPDGGNRGGSADAAWVRWTSDAREMFFGSYGYNGWLYSDLPKYYPQSIDFVYTKTDKIENTSQTPVFVDANWVDLSPKETDPPWPNLYTGAPFGTSHDDGMGRCTIARHNVTSPSSAPRALAPGQKLPGAVTIGFVDGHSHLTRLEDLWTLSWHHGWQAPNPRARTREIDRNFVNTNMMALTFTLGIAGLMAWAIWKKKYAPAFLLLTPLFGTYSCLAGFWTIHRGSPWAGVLLVGLGLGALAYADKHRGKV